MTKRRVSKVIPTRKRAVVPWWSPTRARRVVAETVTREGGRIQVFDLAHARTTGRASGKVSYRYSGKGTGSTYGTAAIRRAFNR